MPETLQPDPKRWTALIFIAIAQLMVVLDATVVNIALPSAQTALHISDSNKQWVVTAYTLSFGGLLLFGGRISDLWGRKNAFIIGLVGFAGASALGGAAANEAMLFGARALQGIFGALLAPAALSLLAVMFVDAKERAKAFGIYGAIAGAGAAVGLILGGVLTQYLNWRWALFVNIAFAAIAALGALAYIHEPAQGRNRDRLDIPGVLLASGGLVALVYGFSLASTDGWKDAKTLGLFVASALLLVAFVFVEGRVKAPLLPLRVVTERNRGGIYLGLGLAVIAMFGLFLFLTFYLQRVMGYSALKSGFAFLPMVAGMIVGSTQIGARLMLRVRPRYLMAPGFLVASLGMLILAQIKVDSSYATVLLPGLVLMGLGMGTAFMPAMSLATHGVRPEDAGVASAMVNTSQQVGGSIGTALLNTLAASATTSWVHVHEKTKADLTNKLFVAQSSVHGYVVAIWWGMGILLLSSVLAFVFVNAEVQNHAERPEGDDAAADAVVPVIAH
ncbi:MFS transporter [Actinacidiphila acididurans]|uniref:MFS transporter n=1 Tax=Actinacidiphila acididurans TaxID=2784346 RepID=A0ABS2TP27_9ACTN|nr:MFS transporter [Actinacidiphila acididurans]MBM9505094.1 MFS transporter [Actinacidiphila acididurans]